MNLLHLAGVLLLPLCGWLVGDAVQARTNAHLAALRHTIALLQRIRQEILYRRTDLQTLYQQLCREELLEKCPGVFMLQQLPAPEALSHVERACFIECFSGLGRTEAEQECERLTYYLARFTEYLQQAQQTARMQAGLSYRLGLAGGAMLALLFW